MTPASLSFIPPVDAAKCLRGQRVAAGFGLASGKAEPQTPNFGAAKSTCVSPRGPQSGTTAREGAKGVIDHPDHSTSAALREITR
jgi:hypothetical protein